MNKIILCANPGKDRGLALTRQVYLQLEAMGQLPVVCLFGGEVRECDAPEDLRSGSLRELVTDARFVVTFGGDGTLLHAARAAAPVNVPVLGVNLGRVGFLTELSAADAAERIVKAAMGDYTLENRMMLDVELCRGGEILYRDFALNDAVVGCIARVVGVRILGDGRKITEYAGDGVVLATPTGPRPIPFPQEVPSWSRRRKTSSSRLSVLMCWRRGPMCWRRTATWRWRSYAWRKRRLIFPRTAGIASRWKAGTESGYPDPPCGHSWCV